MFRFSVLLFFNVAIVAAVNAYYNYGYQRAPQKTGNYGQTRFLQVGSKYGDVKNSNDHHYVKESEPKHDIIDLKNNITALEEWVEELEAQNENLTTWVHDLKDRVADLENMTEPGVCECNTTALEDQLEGLQEENENLTTCVDELKARVTLLENATDPDPVVCECDTTALEEQLEELQEENENLTTCVGDLKARVTLLENATDPEPGVCECDTTALEDQLEELQAENENLTRRLELLEMRVVILENATINRPECPDLFPLEFRDTCYTISDERAKFYDAKTACEQIGGKLAEIESTAVNEFLELYARLDGPAGYWIGGSDRAVEGQFVWVSNGRPVTFTDFGGSPPINNGQNCLQIKVNNNTLWDDANCHNPKQYICETSVV